MRDAPGAGEPSVLMTADAVGGVWSYALALCRGLPAIRFVLATMGPRPTPAQRSEAAALGNLVLAESDYRLEWTSGAEADFAASLHWLEGLARRHAVDLVHVNGFAHARLDTARPVLAVAHSEVAAWWMAVHGEEPPAEWAWYRRQVASGLRAASLVVAPTRAALRELRFHYGARAAAGAAAVVANGTDLARFAPGDKGPVVMAAGRVWDEAKNLAVLDSIAPQLDWPVEIAGPTEHPRGGGVRLPNVRLFGALAADDMARRLGAASIFAAPARYEPFGLAVLEAAAAGCALVLGDIASLREIWDGAALFVHPGDRSALRFAIGRLIADRSERHRLARAARRRAEKFSRERSAQSYLSLYRDLTGGTGRVEVA